MAELSLTEIQVGEVCPGEWIYHYFDTAKYTDGAAHYGPGRHVHFNVKKPGNEGAAIAVTRHLAAPLKTAPPYVFMDYSVDAANATIDLCNVEAGKMYLGLLGVANQ